MQITFPTYYLVRKLYYLGVLLFFSFQILAQDSLYNFAEPFTIPATPEKMSVGKPIVFDAIEKRDFAHYTVDDGLVNNLTMDILQDRRGYLWIGTQLGTSIFDGYEFKNVEELENKSIYSMLEDSKGNIWLGTWDGEIFKYDQNGIKNLTFEITGKYQGVVNNKIYDIEEDNSGAIWFVVQKKGIYQYSKNGVVHYSKEDLKVSSDFHRIFKDRSGNLYFFRWWASRQEGVSKYDGKNFSRLTVENGLPSNKVSDIHEDKKGNIWFANYDRGLSKFDGSDFTNYSKEQGLKSDKILSIEEDQKGNIWLATDGGICKYDGQNFTHFKPKENLYIHNMYCDRHDRLWFQKWNDGEPPSLGIFDGNKYYNFDEVDNHIEKFFEDKEGNMWIATISKGVYQNRRSAFTFYETESEPINRVYGNLLDSQGNLWIGNYKEKNQLLKFTGGKIIGYSLNEYGANQLYEDSQGNIWFNSGPDLVKFDGSSFDKYVLKKHRTYPNISSMIDDNSGNLWLATRNGIIKFDGNSFHHYFYSENKDSKYWTSSVVQDQIGNLWFGTCDGLKVYDGRQFFHYSIGYVISIIEDDSGNLWLGTKDGIQVIKNEDLISKKHPLDSLRLTNITNSFGWKNNNVDELFLDGYGNMWGSTGYGFFQIPNIEKGLSDPSSLEVKQYGKQEGLYFSVSSFNEDDEGNIWIGSHERLIKYNPKLDKPNLLEPQTHITDIQLFLKETDWLDIENEKLKGVRFNRLNKESHLPKNLTLPYNKNHLTFKFIGISLKQQKKVRYQWRLEGSETDWSPISDKREITYSSLPYGEYTFKVKSMNGDGVWNKEPTTFSFEIRPPWWARLLYVIFGLATIYSYIQWRTASLKKRQKELEQTVTERTAEVVAEKEVSEKLLLNILPSETAEELKQYGSAKAKNYDVVTVLFTDFKGFTMHSERLSPENLVAELDHCFKAFDLIMEQHHVEKIKTIGDAYMAAAGLPTANTSNPMDAVKAALAIRDFMLQYKAEREAEDRVAFEIRIGVHTGPVVAGIVGIKKFAYDIWGDTVNLAARMESNGEVGKVNTSQGTFELLKDHPEFQFFPRGKVKAKNKGAIEMYFVENMD